MPTLVELTALTKEELIEMILEGETETVSVATHCEDGQLESLARTTLDAYGEVISKHRIEWTYYITGSEVNEIFLTSMDAEGKVERQQKVKHYRTGRQPVLTEIAVPIELIRG